MNTDLKGAFVVAQSAARVMVASQQRGKILVVSSSQALRPLKGGAHYGASKSGMLPLIKAMSLELAEHRIGVVMLSLGVSASTGNVGKVADPGVWHEVESLIPCGFFSQRSGC